MICIYCGVELGLNQQYYHKCNAMKKAGADSPLAMVEVVKPTVAEALREMSDEDLINTIQHSNHSEPWCRKCGKKL